MPSSQPQSSAGGTPEPAAPCPVLIFAAGFARSATNSGTRIAELIAAQASLGPGTYTVSGEGAPTGAALRNGRTVIGPDRLPVLTVVELDYQSRLEDSELAGGPQSTPGFVRAGLLAVRGLFTLLPALGRAGKTARAKVQLAWGFGSVVVLVVVGGLAVAAALYAMGLGSWLPAWALPPEQHATGFALGAAATVTVIWAHVRTWFTNGAARIERVMNFAEHEQFRATVARTVWEALDDLRDRGSTGRIHLLGYSFGSLVLLEALFPRESDENTEPGGVYHDLASRVASLTTVGCPADFMRLYWPQWFADRRPMDDLAIPWTNILNDSDVFGSNFRLDHDGIRDAHGVELNPPDRDALLPDEQIRYLGPVSTWRVLLMGDLTVHGKYWGTVKEDSCFARRALVRRWVTSPSPRRDDGVTSGREPALVRGRR